MASKEFLDGIPPEGGVKYQLVTGGDNKTSIENVTQWLQEPTETFAADLIAGMVLECDHTKVGTVHTLSNPNASVKSIRFAVADGTEIEEGDSFKLVLKDTTTNLTLVGSLPALESGETAWAFVDGDTINFKKGGGGGSAAFNYKITVAEEEPASPVENEIWINSNVQPAKKWVSMQKPESMANTDVWVQLGEPAGSYFENTDGKVFENLGFSAIYQQVAGTLGQQRGSIFQGGVWVDFQTYLYDTGAVSGVTWSTAPKTGGYPESGDSYANDAGTYLRLGQTNGIRVMGLMTEQSLDLTGKSVLKLNISQMPNGTNLLDVGAYPIRSVTLSAQNVIQNAAAMMRIVGGQAEGVFELDVSALSGSYYVALMYQSNSGSGEFRVSQVWM